MNGAPYSAELEAAVLGELLLDPTLLKKCSLEPDAFFADRHEKVFRAMADLSAKGIPPDLPTLADSLDAESLIFLNEISSKTCTTANFSGHAEKLKELSQKRKLFRACLATLNRIQTEPLNDSLLILRNETAALMQGRAADFVSAKAIADDGWKRIEHRVKTKGQLGGIPSGLKSLDAILDGFKPEFYIVGARPSVGKTALALWSALAAAKAGYRVGFISVEMGQPQIETRLPAIISGVPLWRIQKGLLAAEDWDRISAASNVLSTLLIDFVFTKRSLPDVVASAISLKELRLAEILFVDYIQLIQAEGQTREREISRISGELKALANDLNIPVVALSQLNRESEKRTDRRPSLADLRDSGSLEQDADVVLLLHRAESQEPKGEIEINIAKGRNCGTGFIRAMFDGETQRFSDIK